MVIEPGAQARDVVQQGRRDLLTGEIPDDRAQAMISVKGEAVVDAPYLTLAIQQAVPALAVGVVDDVVEEREPAQPGLNLWRKGEVSEFRVMLHEELH